MQNSILFVEKSARDDPDPPSTTRSSYIHHIITLLARPQASTLPPLPKMLWFTFTLQNFSSRVSIPCFIIRFHPAYVMCKCVYYVYMCIYISCLLSKKISPYSNILSSRDAPIHSPFTPVLHRPSVVEHRFHVRRTSQDVFSCRN